MSTEKQTPQLVLANHPSLGTLHVPIEDYFEFNFWLTEELDDLVAEHLHSQPPRVRRKRIFDDRTHLPDL